MKPNCIKCIHFYVTWEPANPRGCKFFGFKTKAIPSQIVLKSSGQPCHAFQEKNKK